MSQQQQHDELERWGTVFMGPTSDRESSIDKVANREQCEVWNRQAEAEYMARVRARAAMRVEAMLDKARTNSTVIRHAAEEWANKVRLRWEDLHAEARKELEKSRQLREEAEQMRENAYSEGYQMGVEQAMLELDAHKAQLDSMTAAVLSAIQGQSARFYESWREELANLLREAVETSVGWVLTEERAAVLESLLGASVHALENRQRILVRAHPDDEAALREVLEGARQRFPEISSWELEVDPALHPGGLSVESVSGRVENLADARLGVVEQVLRHLTLPAGETDEAALAAVNEAAIAAGLPEMIRETAERELAEREEAARLELEEAERVEAERLASETAEAEALAQAEVAAAAPVDPMAEALEQLSTMSDEALNHPQVQMGLLAEAALPPGAAAEEWALPQDAVSADEMAVPEELMLPQETSAADAVSLPEDALFEQVAQAEGV